MIFQVFECDWCKSRGRDPGRLTEVTVIRAHIHKKYSLCETCSGALFTTAETLAAAAAKLKPKQEPAP